MSLVSNGSTGSTLTTTSNCSGLTFEARRKSLSRQAEYPTWLWPEMTRRSSETLLRSMNKNGSFLVRFSTEKKRYVISLLIKDVQSNRGQSVRVNHYVICCSKQRGFCYLDDNNWFPSLEDLIKHHRKHKGPLPVKLRHPAGRSGWSKTVREVTTKVLAPFRFLKKASFGRKH